MRSRYAAYALGEVDYLLATHPSREPLGRRRRALQASLTQVCWRRLEVLEATAGGPEDTTGTVTFAAHYTAADQMGVMREVSRFGREGQRPDGRWLYLEALELS